MLYDKNYDDDNNNVDNYFNCDSSCYGNYYYEDDSNDDDVDVDVDDDNDDDEPDGYQGRLILLLL